LILNIPDDISHFRFANSECGITILPTEPMKPWKLFVNPKRRFTFQPLSNFIGCNRWGAITRPWT
jgi:hypothetical protein